MPLVRRKNLLNDSLVKEVVRTSTLEPEDRFATLIEVAHRSSDLMIVIADSGAVSYANPAAEETFGISLEQGMGTQAFAYLHPDDSERVQRRFISLIETPGASISDTVRVIHENGEVRFLEIVSTNCLDNAAVAGVVVNGRDITERNEYIERLETRERWFRTLVANSSDLITVLDDQARLIYANPSNETSLGYDMDSLPEYSLLELIHPDDHDVISATFSAVTNEPGISRPSIFRIKTAAGEWRYIEAITNNCLDDPAIEGVVVNARDVTERMILTRTLQTLTQGNEVLVRASDEVTLVADICRTIVETGKYLLAYVGYADHDEAQSVRIVASHGRSSYLDDIHISWGENEFGRGPSGAAIRTGTVQTVDDIRDSEGSSPWLNRAQSNGLYSACALPLIVDDAPIGVLTICTSEPGSFGPAEVAVLRELAGDLSYGIGRLRDADRLKRNELLLRDAERLAHVGHWEWNLTNGSFAFKADEMRAIYGLSNEDPDMSLEAFLSFAHVDDREKVSEAIQRTLDTGSVELVHRIVRPGGQLRHVRMRTEMRRTNGDQSVRMIGISLDVTDQIAAQKEIERTGHFLSAITNNMAEGMIATDGNGIVTYANASAERLLGWKATDVIGRDCHAAFNVRTAQDETDASEECPLVGVWADGNSLNVERETIIRGDGTLIPVAYSASPLRTDELSGAVIVFEDITERVSEQLRIEEQLDKAVWVGRVREALDRDRFVLYSQPIMDLSTNDVIQHELLIRMLSVDGDIIAPANFLPAAEEFGLITEIDRWVVNESVRLAAQGFKIEFNLSAKSVVDPNMLTIIRNALNSFGAPAENVMCEITETALVSDIAAAETFVRGMNDLGCKVALDDFGAGYGGFAYLKRLAVSYLKIDREFVRDLPHEESSRHVVAAVVNLAQAFGMQTIAEGAEDKATLEVLRELGVDHVQGYIVARPRIASEALFD